MMQTLEQLTVLVAPSEEILAVGMATQTPVVVTSRRLIRAGSDAAVSIPFEAISRCEFTYEAHRWNVTLFHEAIDSRRPAGEASQWWRWHDRRRLRRLWRETPLRFSSDQTAAADALRLQLARLGVQCADRGRVVGSGSSGASEWRRT